MCIPWHFLFDHAHYVHTEAVARRAADEEMMISRFDVAKLPVKLDVNGDGRSVKTRWNPPTVDDLNHDTGREFDTTGVQETAPADLERFAPETEAGQRRRRWDLERLREMEVHRMVVMDIRDENRLKPPSPSSDN